tara:strand:+ start:755 stop:1480 length:726 start_codon:yes stop_codon:yes gene_type:complete
MVKFNSIYKLISIIYIFFYLISSRFAICENNLKKNFKNIETELNQRNFVQIQKYFDQNEKIDFKNKFFKLIKEFPDAKWEIIKAKSINGNQYKLDMKLNGSKNLNGKKFKLESSYSFIFNLDNGLIKQSNIQNNLTTIRSDDSQVDITIAIPDKVLTGSKYDIDIILNQPLEETIIAGGIKEYQEEKLLNQSIPLEPLATGGIFKVSRAPLKAGTQIWTGIIAHPSGLVSFTKTVKIVEDE